MAEWSNSRGTVNEPVGLKVPVFGSNNSGLPTLPTTRTRPSGSTEAVKAKRERAMDPVGLKVPVAGSYSSAEARGTNPSAWPPAMRTRPSCSSVAVCLMRSVAIEPVGLNGEATVGEGDGVGSGWGVPKPQVW